MRSPRLAERYGMIWRSKKSRSAASESASVAAVAFAGVAVAIGWAIVAAGGFSPGAAAEDAIGVGGTTAFGSIAGETFSSGFFSGTAIVSAVLVDPTPRFAREYAEPVRKHSRRAIAPS